MTTNTSPGWFPDPRDPSIERLWDGQQWTQNTRPVTTSNQVPLSAAAVPPTPTTTMGDNAMLSLQEKPKTHVWWAVIALFFFCLPLGLVGIIYATKVNGLWDLGEYAKAKNYSKKALIWSLIGLGLGVLGYSAVVVSIALNGMAGTFGGPFSCSDLASQAVRISGDLNAGTSDSTLLKVENPRLVLDRQSGATPPASGRTTILQCTGLGFFSRGENAEVNLTLELDSDGESWVYYEAQ